MQELRSHSDDRQEALATLQHALERTILLARHLSRDPLIGGEVRGLLTRLDCIQAEVDVMTVIRAQVRPSDNHDDIGAHRLWQ